jgi:hypothetical protein
MTITKQSIVDAYNSIYSADNGRDKTFNELTESEKEEALLVINGNSSGGSGGSGASGAEIQNAIETATNLQEVETAIKKVADAIIYDSGEARLRTYDLGLSDEVGSINSLWVSAVANGVTQGTSKNFNISRSSNSTEISLLLNTDVSNYSSLTVQITGTFSASIQVKGGNINDINNQIVLPVINLATGAKLTTIINPGIYLVPKAFRYISCSPTVYTSGTITADWLFTNEGDFSGYLDGATQTTLASVNTNLSSYLSNNLTGSGSFSGIGSTDIPTSNTNCILELNTSNFVGTVTFTGYTNSTIAQCNIVYLETFTDGTEIISGDPVIFTGTAVQRRFVFDKRFVFIRLNCTIATSGTLNFFFHDNGTPSANTVAIAQTNKTLSSIEAKLPALVSGELPVTSINYLTGFNVVDRTTTGTFYEGSIPQSKSLVFQVTGNFTATNIIAQSRIGSVFSYETIDVYDVKNRDWVSSIIEAGIYIVPNNAEMVKIELTAIAGGTVSFDYILRDDNLVSYKQTSKQSYFDSFNVNVPSGSGATFYDPTLDLKKLIFTNNSANTVFFDFTSSVSSSVYIFKLEPGETFIDEGENINKDATYYAVANNATSAVRVARWI